MIKKIILVLLFIVVIIIIIVVGIKKSSVNVNDTLEVDMKNIVDDNKLIVEKNVVLDDINDEIPHPILDETYDKNQNEFQNNLLENSGSLSLPAPVFLTQPASSITSNSAQFNAKILGLMDINSVGQNVYFEYGLSETNLGTTTTGGGSVQGDLIEVVSGLQPNTNYYFRAVVDFGYNSIPPNSKKYGNIMSFKTL